MIVPMTKLNLVGLTYHENIILDALHKTGLVDISVSKNSTDNTVNGDEYLDNLKDKYARVNKAINFYYDYIDKAKGQSFYPNSISEYNNFIISYDEFMSISAREDGIWNLIEKTEKLAEEIAVDKQEIVKLKNLSLQLIPYIKTENKFSYYHDTKLTKVLFGTIKKESLSNLDKLSEYDAYYEVLADAPLSVIVAVSFNNCASETSKVLNENGFNKCPFNFDASPKQKIDEINGEIKFLENKTTKISKDLCENVKDIKELKILSDYYKFLIDKQNVIDNFSCTKSTFSLEGYFPKGSEEKIKTALEKITDAIFFEFCEPTEQDTPPTLTKNNKVIRQAEFITDMYSSPQYTEVDPNKGVFFFFVLFMGIIMADIVYGIVMLFIGLYLSKKNKIENGASKLWMMIAYGGAFSIFFGILFNSFLGYSLLQFTLLPSPVPDGNGTDNLKLILLLCLGLGIFQIMVGYFYKGLNCLKNKDIAGFFFDGLVWIIFFIGFILATFNFLFDYLMSDSFSMNTAVKEFFSKTQFAGIIIVLASLVIAALTAGRNERGFGKFSKGFGSVYGLINLFSDILSYARLFGLLLSGMIIAQTFNDIGAGLFSIGFFGYILGGLVIFAGHAFNLAMGVLGAYIHDSRLQYIEFFSKFYTGEGNKFSPIGSDMQYVYIKK